MDELLDIVSNRKSLDFEVTVIGTAEQLGQEEEFEVFSVAENREVDKGWNIVRRRSLVIALKLNNGQIRQMLASTSINQDLVPDFLGCIKQNFADLSNKKLQPLGRMYTTPLTESQWTSKRGLLWDLEARVFTWVNAFYNTSDFKDLVWELVCDLEQ